MDHSQVNKHVAVRSNQHSELANTLCHSHVCIHACIWDAVQSGSEGHDHQFTWALVQEGNDSYLEGAEASVIGFWSSKILLSFEGHVRADRRFQNACTYR